MQIFKRWARAKSLEEKKTQYFMKKKGGKRQLQFSKSGSNSIENLYKTYYVAREMSEKKQEII